MHDALDIHRVHFAVTIVFHYIFPQITMGLAFLIVVLKAMGLRGDGHANDAARFWIRVFAVCFVFGVVTGIPMEFQFGTNWARFSERAGAVVGQTLAMEGVFAFFLESSFLYALIAGEKRLGPKLHFGAAVLLWIGTWLSAFFIVTTNAWMQHPVAYEMVDGKAVVTSIPGLLMNPWALAAWPHVMMGTLITASFVMAGVGAFYMLRAEHEKAAKRFMSVSLIVALGASVAAAFPTGDVQAKLVHAHQPATFAAMEGHYHTEDGAGLVVIGQPNMRELELDNPIVLPKFLSFLTEQRWDATILGLSEFPEEEWPDNPELLYYSYHIMAGLGTIFIGVSAAALFFHLRGTLARRRWLLWALMLCMPLPFIANTAGWMTAELGRQPWIIYGVMRTSEGHSLNVSRGNALFSLLGFAGLYVLLGLLFVIIMLKLVARGPVSRDGAKGLTAPGETSA